MGRDRSLAGLLIAVLLLNLTILASTFLENAQPRERLQWAQMALTGAACVMLLRALKVSRELRSQVRRLTDVNRLLS